MTWNPCRPPDPRKIHNLLGRCVRKVSVRIGLGLRVDDEESVTLLPSREKGDVCLVVGCSVAEIQLERTHLEALREQIPAALAALDVVDADNVACDRAAEAGRRALDAVSRARDAANEAELLGDEGRMAALLAAADHALAAAKVVDAVIAKVDQAAVFADSAAEHALGLANGQPETGQ